MAPTHESTESQPPVKYLPMAGRGFTQTVHPPRTKYEYTNIVHPPMAGSGCTHIPNTHTIRIIENTTSQPLCETTTSDTAVERRSETPLSTYCKYTEHMYTLPPKDTEFLLLNHDNGPNLCTMTNATNTFLRLNDRAKVSDSSPACHRNKQRRTLCTPTYATRFFTSTTEQKTVRAFLPANAASNEAHSALQHTQH